jgi:sulfotransferase
MKIHFISGLTRSGSTLLAGILKQNPAFITGPTSPVLRIFQSVEYGTSQENDFACAISEDQKLALRRAVFTSMYPDSNRIVFDKHHFWTGKMAILATLFPRAKVICCVRNPSWIMDSWERVYQSNPFEMSAFFNFKTDTTVYIRCAKLAASEGAVGRPFEALREAYHGPWRDRLHLIDYTQLATHPEATIHRLYEVIGERPFKHDFHNVEMSFDEFDQQMGMPGLHRVGREVRFVTRDTILPPDLFDRYRDDAFWTSQHRHYRASAQEAA